MTIDMSKTAFLFPGQGSQQVGMGQDLAAEYPAARALFEQADDILGFPLSRLMWEGPEEQLTETINTQPALYVHSMAALAVFSEQYPEFKPAFMAGHSLGELTAVAAAGGMSFEDGLKLVRRRGELMTRAGEIAPGGMAAILALDIPVVDELCQQASNGNETVVVANDNCPGQVVVSGHHGAVERLVTLAQETGARRAVKLAVSIAAHSELMRIVQDDFARAVNESVTSVPEVTVIGNVIAGPLKGIQAIQNDIRDQLTSRVRWTESVEYMLEQGVENFVEIGSGDVLIGLVKRIDRKANRLKLGELADFEALHELLS